ncbi:MAG: SiaB family protein kinase [Desulfovibrio sp.]|uniref:SiaB family protein kinase n=1 Tax=Desulfovibrio sp. 7SRBS1 TaxID=3378064 RepID=UPI003B3C057D
MLQKYRHMEGEGVVLYFCGPICQGLVEGLGDVLRCKMASENHASNTVRKVFAVLVEQMQNVVNYAGENPRGESSRLGMGQILVSRNNGGFTVSCGNRISPSMKDKIRTKIEIVNGMDKEQLKIYYREQRRKTSDTDSLGAGLGFIEMARKASRPLTYSFDPMEDEGLFFVVNASLDMEGK